MDSGNSGKNDATMQMAYSGRMTQRIYISFFLHLFSVASTHSTPAMLSLSTSSILAVSVLDYPLSHLQGPRPGPF